MTVKGKKPILVAGLGLSAGLWLWESLHDKFAAFGEWGLLAVIGLGAGLWAFKKNAATVPPQSPLTKEVVDLAIAKTKATIAILEAEAPSHGRPDKIAASLESLKQAAAQLPGGFQRPVLQLAIAGGKKVGKSTLRQILELRGEIEADISWVETEALFTEAETAIVPSVGTQGLGVPLHESDLVLFLVTGDLTESERQFLQQLRCCYQRSILVFNKQDRYLPEAREEIRQLLQQRLQELLPAEDVIAIAAAPQPVKVLHHQADGSVIESLEQPTIQVAALRERLREILRQERESLIWGTLWRRATALQQQAKATLNQVRRERAIPTIEQYQWLAAAAAFANPVAALDLLATAAISTQMVIDLSEIYQQKFSLSQAQAAAGEIGKLMVQLGLVELSSSCVASLLKSNALTYLAGGAIQGVSAAYLARLAGLSLMEYLEEQEIERGNQVALNWERLGAKLKQVFAENQRSAALQGFVQQAIALGEVRG